MLFAMTLIPENQRLSGRLRTYRNVPHQNDQDDQPVPPAQSELEIDNRGRKQSNGSVDETC